MLTESKFQAIVIKELEDMFDGCVILKNDPTYVQGIPDLSIFWNDRWAMLEVKATIFAPYRPNQEWYLNKLDRMSYATMICPENKEEVYFDLQRTFGLTR